VSVPVTPYDPEVRCPSCGAGPGGSVYHARPVLKVFGRQPDFPCAGTDGRLAEHLCCRCGACGHAWVSELLP
jgi:hypothetical protein